MRLSRLGIDAVFQSSRGLAIIDGPGPLALYAQGISINAAYFALSGRGRHTELSRFLAARHERCVHFRLPLAEYFTIRCFFIYAAWRVISAFRADCALFSRCFA